MNAVISESNDHCCNYPLGKAWSKLSINIQSVKRKAVMLLALTSILISISPASADPGHDKRQKHQVQRDHHRHFDRHDRHAYRRYYERRHGYAQPVYAPTPVYYEPQQSPGISLFFPLNFRR